MAKNNYQLRLYDPMVVAENYIEDDFDKAGNQAFRKRLGTFPETIPAPAKSR